MIPWQTNINKLSKLHNSVPAAFWDKHFLWRKGTFVNFSSFVEKNLGRLVKFPSFDGRNLSRIYICRRDKKVFPKCAFNLSGNWSDFWWNKICWGLRWCGCRHLIPRFDQKTQSEWFFLFEKTNIFLSLDFELCRQEGFAFNQKKFVPLRQKPLGLWKLQKLFPRKILDEIYFLGKENFQVNFSDTERTLIGFLVKQTLEAR